MGILVNGAELVEEGVEELSRNLRNIKEEAKANQRMRSAWKAVRGSLASAGMRLRPIIRKMDPEYKLEIKMKKIMAKAESRTRLMLTDMLGRTILGLENVRQRLDRESQRKLHAAA